MMSFTYKKKKETKEEGITNDVIRYIVVLSKENYIIIILLNYKKLIKKTFEIGY